MASPKKCIFEQCPGKNKDLKTFKERGIVDKFGYLRKGDKSVLVRKYLGVEDKSLRSPRTIIKNLIRWSFNRSETSAR